LWRLRGSVPECFGRFVHRREDHSSRILPQGKPERDMRAIRMVTQMNAEGFGGCTNIGECTGVCPKEIPLEVIAAMNRDYIRGSWRERDNLVVTMRQAVYGVEHWIEAEGGSERKLICD
jgi:ferredoxin